MNMQSPRSVPDHLLYLPLNFSLIGLMAGSSLALPVGLLLKGLFLQRVGLAQPPCLFTGLRFSPQASTTSPLSFATKPGVPHRPVARLGLQALTKAFLVAEALQL